MRKNINTSVLVLSLFVLGLGCTPKSGTSEVETGADESAQPRLVWLDVPAAPGSGEPNLFTDKNGNVVLSWVEENEEGSKLKFSQLADSQWKPATEIASGDDWFVNWADFPSVAVREDGGMAAHYLAKNGEGTFAYGVNMTFSNNIPIRYS